MNLEIRGWESEIPVIEKVNHPSHYNFNSKPKEIP